MFINRPTILRRNRKNSFQEFFFCNSSIFFQLTFLEYSIFFFFRKLFIISKSKIINDTNAFLPRTYLHKRFSNNIVLIVFSHKSTFIYSSTSVTLSITFLICYLKKNFKRSYFMHRYIKTSNYYLTRNLIYMN